MATVTFKTKENDSSKVEDVNEGAKLLAVAVRSKQDIRFGCSSGKCGTCAVEVTSGSLSEMKQSETDLLNKMGIIDGTKIRLSCMARLESADVEVDLNFQDKYDPSAFGFD
jgi:ferredoxin